MLKTRCVPLARGTNQDKVSFMNVLINNEFSEFEKMDKI